MGFLDQLRSPQAVKITAMSQAGFMSDSTALAPMMPGLPAAAAIGADIERRLARASDGDLLAAFGHTKAESGNPEADALLAEIKRRELDMDV